MKVILGMPGRRDNMPNGGYKFGNVSLDMGQKTN